MGRNLVICCDGTSNNVYRDSTNVLRLYRSLVRSDEQLTYYDPGVGVLTDPTKKTRIGKWWSRCLDMGVGLSVRENVCRAYEFLAKNYRPGDKIFLFGFSRGAYTIRSLAGMIHFLGLCRPELAHLSRSGWAIYADDGVRLTREEFFEAGSRFKKSFAVKPDARIHFLGAWDTVSAFGFIWDLRSTPHTSDNPSIDHIRHAVAIDERRALFEADLFHPKDAAQHKSFEEVWFAGSHGDVGGGWPLPKSGLAKITLQWMYQEAEAAGLAIDPLTRARYTGASPIHKEEPGPDPTCPVNRSLKPGWWGLELVPRRRWRAGRMRWSCPHIGRRRRIAIEAKIHVSVSQKILGDVTYKPENLPTSTVRNSM